MLINKGFNRLIPRERAPRVQMMRGLAHLHNESVRFNHSFFSRFGDCRAWTLRKTYMRNNYKTTHITYSLPYYEVKHNYTYAETIANANTCCGGKWPSGKSSDGKKPMSIRA